MARRYFLAVHVQWAATCRLALAFFLQPYIPEAGPAFVFDILLIRRQSFVVCRVCGTCLLSDSRRTAFDVLFEVGRLLM